MHWLTSSLEEYRQYQAKVDKIYYDHGAAFMHLQKEAAVSEVAFSLTGKLYLSGSGWLLLSVPNALVRGVFDALHEPGAELPLRSDGQLEAHISVMSPEELQTIGGASKITERGHEYRYSLGQLKSVEPNSWSGVARVWYCTVSSPALENLRKSYGLEPRRNGYDLHITVAKRKARVLQNNEVSKAAEDLTAEELTAAANKADKNPSEEQKESGNYRKGHVFWKGLGLTIENSKGSIRRGTDEEGKKWETTMTAHYGYIKKTKSEADGDHVDFFFDPSGVDSDFVCIVNQTKPNGSFDEHKVVFGTASEEEAKKLYLSNYSDDWKGFHSCKSMSLDKFKEWLEEGDTSKKAEVDVLPGGKGDLKSIMDFNADEMAKGVQTEKEHTVDEEIAADIAKDHLTEDKNYYTKLRSIDKGVPAAADGSVLRAVVAHNLSSFHADEKKASLPGTLGRLLSGGLRGAASVSRRVAADTPRFARQFGRNWVGLREGERLLGPRVTNPLWSTPPSTIAQHSNPVVRSALWGSNVASALPNMAANYVPRPVRMAFNSFTGSPVYAAISAFSPSFAPHIGKRVGSALQNLQRTASVVGIGGGAANAYSIARDEIQARSQAADDRAGYAARALGWQDTPEIRSNINGAIRTAVAANFYSLLRPTWLGGDNTAEGRIAREVTGGQIASVVRDRMYDYSHAPTTWSDFNPFSNPIRAATNVSRNMSLLSPFGQANMAIQRHLGEPAVPGAALYSLRNAAEAEIPGLLSNPDHFNVASAGRIGRRLLDSMERGDLPSAVNVSFPDSISRVVGQRGLSADIGQLSRAGLVAASPILQAYRSVASRDPKNFTQFLNGALRYFLPYTEEGRRHDVELERRLIAGTSGTAPFLAMMADRNTETEQGAATMRRAGLGLLGSNASEAANSDVGRAASSALLTQLLSRLAR